MAHVLTQSQNLQLILLYPTLTQDHGGNGRGAPKRAGENTDYGDYNILILEHLAATHTAHNKKSRPIQLKELVPRWQKRLTTWRAWMCTMTRETAQQVQRGMALSQIGGFSNAMAVRHAAAYAYFNQEKQVVDAALTSMFTHRETTALDGGAFFAKVTFRILHKDLSPRQAIESVAAEPTSSSFIRKKVKQALDKVDEALDESSSLSQEEYVDDLSLTSMARLWDVGKTEPIKVGKASPTEGTLPGSIYFIVKYSTLEQEGKIDNAYSAAASANAEVGGDNASRSIVIGMVLGAWSGVDAIPKKWKDTYVEWERCEALIKEAPMLSSINSNSVSIEEL
jgi:ADP-ribosylglycohydrolase